MTSYPPYAFFYGVLKPTIQIDQERYRRPWGASWTELEGSAGLSADEAARIAWMSMHGVATLMLENRFNPVGAAKAGREQLINRTIDVLFSGLGALRKTR